MATTTTTTLFFSTPTFASAASASASATETLSSFSRTINEFGPPDDVLDILSGFVLAMVSWICVIVAGAGIVAAVALLLVILARCMMACLSESFDRPQDDYRIAPWRDARYGSGDVDVERGVPWREEGLEGEGKREKGEDEVGERERDEVEGEWLDCVEEFDGMEEEEEEGEGEDKEKEADRK